ncbi:MAG: bifunctional methionine sulfoxide reductase B/A protein [Deltaproteobacteria bacterium]|nr:bifunctional methionine sulfoxide reductase B/A protein [Deltaproteobacteria bacterium]
MKFRKPNQHELKKTLSPLQYKVTQEEATERAFDNEYWDNKKPGIYVDLVSGEPLFSSTHKYDSKTGWPSFFQPLEPEHLVSRDDYHFFTKRIELRSKLADSHLGHVFDDGPAPTGLRYCINSAALRFIPVEKLKEEGYERYLPLFAEKGGQGMTEQTKATFAGGCFWCMEKPFDEVDGVISTSVGYTGGQKQAPTYKEVSAGGTGHAEALEVMFDPSKITYEKLLDVFWHNVDPVAKDRQFCDVGNQYRSEIFYHNAEQKKLAEASRKAIEEAKNLKIATPISEAGEFYKAEEYHQEYYKKHPILYRVYRFNCGRDKRLEEFWGSKER